MLPEAAIEVLLRNVITDKADELRKKLEPIVYNMPIINARASGFKTEPDDAGYFLFVMWEFLRDVLINGNGYINIIPGKVFQPLESSNMSTDGGGTLESTVYVFTNNEEPYEPTEFEWSTVIHVEIQPVENVGWRLYGWLPTGEVVIRDNSQIAPLLENLIEVCVIDVLRRFSKTD